MAKIEEKVESVPQGTHSFLGCRGTHPGGTHGDTCRGVSTLPPGGAEGCLKNKIVNNDANNFIEEL